MKSRVFLILVFIIAVSGMAFVFSPGRVDTACRVRR